MEIQLPKGFELESVESPAEVFDESKVGYLQVSISVDKEANILRLKRNFYFGRDGKILYPPTLYQPLKFLFDTFHKTNSHTVTLRHSGN